MSYVITTNDVTEKALELYSNSVKEAMREAGYISSSPSKEELMQKALQFLVDKNMESFIEQKFQETLTSMSIADKASSL